MDIRVFVSDYDIEPEKCKKYMLFPEPVFKEIRKSRIKDKIGELITVQKSGWNVSVEKLTNACDKSVGVFPTKALLAA